MTTEAKKEEIFEQIYFKKPETGNKFLFCGTCALAQRSDTISRHFRNCHSYLVQCTLGKGQEPLFPFTNRWKKYIKECTASKRAITKN